MNALIIRKARIEELETIQELNHQLFLNEEKFDSFLNMNWTFENNFQHLSLDRENFLASGGMIWQDMAISGKIW